MTAASSLHGFETSIRPHNTRAEMYAGRVVCFPVVSHVEYAVLRLENTRQPDRRTDGRHTVTLRLPLDTACIIKARWAQTDRYIGRQCISNILFMRTVTIISVA